jgi:hypothetical protein
MERQEIPKNATSPEKYRFECILLSIVFSDIFIKARKAELYLQCVCVCVCEREGGREGENLRKRHTSSSDKFILKLTLHQERMHIISRKHDKYKELEKFKR